MTKFILVSLLVLSCSSACGNNDTGTTNNPTNPPADSTPDVMVDQGMDQVSDEGEDEAGDEGDESSDVVIDYDDPEAVIKAIREVSAETICSAAFDCRGEAGAFLSFLAVNRYPDKAACLDDFTRDDAVTLFASSIDAWRTGLITYEQSIAETCAPLIIKTLEELRCNPAASISQLARGLDAQCSALFTGTRLIGESCMSDATCASDNCREADGCQVCGDAEQLPPCGDGGVCPSNQLCIDDACVAYGTLGESCSRVGFSESSCKSGLVCKESNGTSTCVEARTAGQGQPCTGDAECVAGTICGDGDVCVLASSELPLSNVGDPCALTSRTGALRTSACGTGLACRNVDPSTDEGTCGAYSLEGEGCGRSAECIQGTYCNTQSGVCQAEKLMTGVACDVDEECVSGYCGFGNNICKDLVGGGGFCSLSEECESGVCNNGACTTLTCP